MPEPRIDWTTPAVISAGGVLGSLARHGLSVAFPHQAGRFDWAIFAVNTAGCLLIGVLMVLITEVWEVHRLVRPFLGIGVLGGFTTFSAYVVGIQQDLAAGAPHTALAYLAGTCAAALAAVHAGVHATRLVAVPHPRKEPP
ncbi:fluoride efflux transporter CrcB [Actinomadura craniellae]|uniref:Fluoride-specific ion channel FluC n=1 Tax=Actinomadura craniellae TaxID=2231787 RepID=A0A365H4L7_9ACTN|nr:CrcB family protein [Actinomadura craniellae]RAY14054.1 fluoride efflux transporter CrcB [Actinomadura craniellae]